MEGALISLADVSQEQLLKTAVELSNKGIRHTFQVVDVGQDGAVERLVKRTVENFGSLDILVTISDRMRQDPLVELSELEWKRALHVNVTGAFLACRQAARIMQGAQQGGRIITIVADKTLKEQGANPPYCPTAGAVVMFTKALAYELACYGITVNSICPELAQVVLAAEEFELDKAPPATHSPEEPGNMLAETVSLVCYLSTAEAGSITGALFTQGGGG